MIGTLAHKNHFWSQICQNHQFPLIFNSVKDQFWKGWCSQFSPGRGQVTIMRLPLLLLLLFSSQLLAEQSLGYSYELDSPDEGVKFRGFGPPPIMRNMLMPIVRNTLWLLRSYKHFVETFTFQHSLSLTYPKVIKHLQDGQHVSGKVFVKHLCSHVFNIPEPIKNLRRRMMKMLNRGENTRREEKSLTQKVYIPKNIIGIQGDIFLCWKINDVGCDNFLVPKERETVKQEILSSKNDQKREELNLTSILSSALTNHTSVKIIVFKASDAMNEQQNHHDQQINTSLEERFVPSHNDPINTETRLAEEECGLAKWYWACQHFANWNKNIF